MKRKNQILGITSILLSAVAFIMISRMAAAFSLAPKDPGPRLYPSISAGLIGIFGIAVLLDREETKEFLQKNQWGRLFLLYGIFVIYAIGIYFLGFLYPSVLMLFATCTLFAGEKKVPLWIRVAYAVVLGIAVTYAFQSVFSVPMPKGLLFK